MLIFLSSFIVGFSFLFFLMSQPLSMGMLLLLLSLFTSLMIGMISSAWMGYVLFLVYVGGLLVMFGYIAVCSPNVLYKTNMLVRGVGGVSLSLFLAFMISWSLSELIMGSGNEVMEADVYGGLCTQLYSYNGMVIVISLGLILLLALLGVVKICYFFSGPLRPFL